MVGAFTVTHLLSSEEDEVSQAAACDPDTGASAMASQLHAVQLAPPLFLVLAC